MRKLLKYILLMLIITLIVSFGNEDSNNYAGGIIEGKELNVNLINDDELREKVTGALDEGETIATQFFATTDFNSISVYTEKTKNVDLIISIYKWNTNYETTISSNPIVKERKKSYNKNTYLTVSFEALSAGEYIWELKSERKGFEYEMYLNKPDNIRAFLSHQETARCFNLRLHYINTPTNTLHTISENKVTSRKAPAEVKSDYLDQLGIQPDTWFATDGLGRTLSGYQNVGKKRKDKFVGIFYWTWHDSHSQSVAPRNVQQLLDSLSEEEAINAKNNYEHSVWKNIGGYHFWNEPVFGYYSTIDKYVLRKHAELLADAGVDVIIFDCTNGDLTWQMSYYTLLETFTEAKEQGVKTPKIAFILNFAPLNTTEKALNKIYMDIYRTGKFKDLWFYWEGKPLILAHEQALDPYDEIDKEILEFFTFRNNDALYFTKKPAKNSWGWLSIYPQCKYGVDKKGNIEQMTVGVAQNATDTKLTAMNGTNVHGRSYSYGDYSYSYTYRESKNIVTSNIENSKLYGINFQQQWDYAIENDPEFVFVTGWNEWVAIRFKEWGGAKNGMADQFNDEYSRDIEPSKGELKDHYYYQLVENIRRYKGVSKPIAAKAEKTIDIFGDLSQWSNITAFNHYTKNTYTRDDDGYRTKHYTNNTMRNDIKSAKVAFDTQNIYFYVETVDNLTMYTDTSWMRLFLDTQVATSDSTDWEGFELVVNRLNPTESIAYVEKSIGGWDWETAGEVRYSVNNNVLQIEVPRDLLGFNDKTDPEFNFKWSDNMQTEDIMDFYENGDSAPGGRFMFHFSTKEISDGLSDKTIVIITIVLGLLLVISISVTVFIIMQKKRNTIDG